MISSLLLQECPACLVRLTLIVFVMGGRWPYSCCFVGYCLQALFKIARSILVQLPSSFFSSRLVSVHVVHPYRSIDTTAAWKKLCLIFSVRSDFHMTDPLNYCSQKLVAKSVLHFVHTYVVRSCVAWLKNQWGHLPRALLLHPRSTSCFI